MIRRFMPAVVVALGVATITQAANNNGGWTTQTIPIDAGWNFIWLEVDPGDGDPAVVLADAPVCAIWSYQSGRRGQTGTWVSYEPGRASFLNTLGTIQGGRAYLIDATAPVVLEITGRPVVRDLSVFADDATAHGGNVDPASQLTLEDYFAFLGNTDAIQSAYQMVGGNYVPLPLNGEVAAGSAHWVLSSSDLSPTGRLRTNAPIDGIQFGKGAYTRELTVEVPLASVAQVVHVRGLDSATPPPGQPGAAGSDGSWLEYRDEGAGAWMPLADGVDLTLPAGESEATVTLRCVRRGHPATTVAQDDALYHGLIEVRDDFGYRMLVPAGMEIEPVTGLWVGQAQLNRVSLDSSLGDPEPAAAPAMLLTLILDVGGDGTYRLLDSATVDVSRDGNPLTYRYEALTFPEPVPLTGSVDGGVSGTLTGALTLSATHPLNPYRHRYSPEHGEGYAVTRTIELDFQAQDPDPMHANLGLSDTAGDNELVGTYRESITGLSLEPVVVEGSFHLFRVSSEPDQGGAQ